MSGPGDPNIPKLLLSATSPPPPSLKDAFFMLQNIQMITIVGFSDILRVEVCTLNVIHYNIYTVCVPKQIMSKSMRQLNFCFSFYCFIGFKTDV